jgi:hypothetical protein
MVKGVSRLLHVNRRSARRLRGVLANQLPKTHCEIAGQTRLGDLGRILGFMAA